jgi:hypothetical protein
MKVLIWILFCAVLAHAAVGESPDNAWQQKVIAKYPSLRVEGSDFNKKFVAAYNSYQKTNPSFFSTPQWPPILADQIAAWRRHWDGNSRDQRA